VRLSADVGELKTLGMSVAMGHLVKASKRRCAVRMTPTYKTIAMVGLRLFA
jgi:hypothetical protein